MDRSHNFQGPYTNVCIAKVCLNEQWKRKGTEGYGRSSGAGGECSSQLLFLVFHNGVTEKVFHSWEAWIYVSKETFTRKWVENCVLKMKVQIFFYRHLKFQVLFWEKSISHRQIINIEQFLCWISTYIFWDVLL